MADDNDYNGGIYGYYNMKTGEIVREHNIWNNYFYVNCEAFMNQTDEVCYIPELSDDKYTYADFVKIAKGNISLAKHLFETVEWQSPETLFEDLIVHCDVIDKDGYWLDEDGNRLPFDDEKCRPNFALT